jgi:hypothetical protein
MSKTVADHAHTNLLKAICFRLILFDHISAFAMVKFTRLEVIAGIATG